MNKATRVIMSCLTVLLLSTASWAQSTLIFSEYIEGSSNNKALEVYNPGETEVDLAEYQIAQSVNGGGWEFYHEFPTGATIAAGGVYVIANDGISDALYDTTNADEVLAYPSVVHHNGDDARAIIHISGTDTTIIDVFGDPDNDPGSAWDVGGVTGATANHTLVRKPSVTTGNTTTGGSFGTDAVTSEWIVLDQNVFSELGAHNVDMSGALTDPAGDVVASWNFDDMSLGVWTIDTNPDYGTGGTVEVSADVSASGDYSAKVAAVDTLEKTGITTTNIAGLGIQEGDTLYFRVWVSATDTSRFDGLQPYTQSGTDWSQWSDQYYNANELTPNAWNWISVVVPAPKDGVFQKAGLQVTGTAEQVAETPVVYVDDISIVRPESIDPVSVTFMVNTATMPDTMMSDHFLQVRGGVVGADVAGTGLGSTITWDNTSLAATNVGGDYWTVSFDMSPGDTLNYKFWAGVDADTPLINGSEQGWESGDNNQFILSAEAAGDTTAPMQWYETREAPFTSESDSVTVYFRVNVGAQVQTDVFDPETEKIGILGNPAFFPNPADWASEGVNFYLDQLPNPTGDNLFYGGYHRIHKDSVANIDGQVGYKFVIENSDGSIGWEEGSDSFINIPDHDTTAYWKFFSNTPPTTGDVVTTGLNFEVNVGILEGLGYFNSSLDSVYVTGTFNSWTNTGNQMAFNDISGNYEALNIPLTTTVGTQVSYKYYIRWDASRDDETSDNYFEFISANDDGWEEPGVTGGGNRLFNIIEGDQQPTRSEYFNGQEPQALMTSNNVEGGAIDVTFSIDMSPATEADTPFLPESDSVFLSVETPFFALTQDLPTYSDDIATRSLEIRDRMMFTDEDGDMVYELTLPLQLPTLNHIGFNVVYGEPTSPTGTIIETGGGTDPGRRFYQYVTPQVDANLAVTWPSSFTFPTLTWTSDPVPFELPPDYTAVSNEVDGEVAESFQLMQNYPNPFNPTTNISFNLPNAADVNLSVYNLLGQRVATLIDGRTMNSGSHTVAFDARNLASGVYIYRLEAGNYISNKRMTLIK